MKKQFFCIAIDVARGERGRVGKAEISEYGCYSYVSITLILFKIFAYF